MSWRCPTPAAIVEGRRHQDAAHRADHEERGDGLRPHVEGGAEDDADDDRHEDGQNAGQGVSPGTPPAPQPERNLLTAALSASYTRAPTGSLGSGRGGRGGGHV